MNQFEIDCSCEAIVFGSLCSMCTAIRLSGYMSDAAQKDLNRSDEFLTLADDYAKLAVHLLKDYTESDHLETIRYMPYNMPYIMQYII